MKLLIYLATMRLNGFHGQEHHLADLLVGVPAGYQLQDLQFTAGQLLDGWVV